MCDEVATDEGDINKMVFEMIVAKIKYFVERRVSQGASNEQLNEELKQFLLVIYKYAKRERILLRLM